IEGAGDRHLKTVFAALLLEQAAQRDKPRVGEKTPAHDEHMSTLLEWYPDARIVYVIRDPRAVVASVMRTPWGARHSVLAHARRWRRSIGWVRALTADGRVSTVCYEELVRNPEEELRKVCRHVNVEWTADLLARREPDVLLTARRQGWAK